MYIMVRKQKIAPEEKGRLLRRLRQGEISQAQAAQEAGIWPGASTITTGVQRNLGVLTPMEKHNLYFSA